MTSFRWIPTEEMPKQIKLRFHDQREVYDYQFAAMIESDASNNFAALKKYQMSDVNRFLMPCRGLSSYQTDTTVIGIYAKPRYGEYEWVRIKAIKLQSVNESLHTTRVQQEDEDRVTATDKLVAALLGTLFEIRNSKHALRSLGLRAEEKSEWIQFVTPHPLLFQTTAYRRKLVIERLIVEIKLWRTEWIHRILEQKMKNKPMIQWVS